VKATASTYLEIAVAIAEAVLLWSASRSRSGRSASTPFRQETDATVVRVVGEQFAWNIHYPGPDGKFGRTDIKLIDLRRTRWASIAPIPTPRTTSRPSTSFTCRSTSRRS
jgi:cytochrome c oxidase subunit 2